jgi:hypothetical protein
MIEKVFWTFYGYLTPAGGKEVQEWFDALLEEEQDEARDTIAYLQSQPVQLWVKPDHFPLGDGLSEIRFKVNSLNREYRIYGFFWPKGKRFSYTFLLGRDKKVGNPKHDIAEARKRKDRIESGKASTYEFEFQKGANC